MQLFRRSVFRAATSPSLLSKSRSITTSTPFVVRSKAQSSISTSVFRRFNSGSTTPYNAEEPLPAATETPAPAPFAFGSANESNDRRADRFEDRPVRKIAPSNKIYVGNLLFDVNEEDLKKEFAPFGTVKSAVIITDARGLSKGFGNVEFETVEEATAAIEAKHQTVMEGRRLVVNYVSKSSRPASTNAPSKTLFIGNLAFEMSDADLNKLFREIRNVIDVRVAIDRRTGQPRGFAHADFVDVDSAVKGMEILQGKEIYGRNLRVDYSTPAQSRR